MNSGPMWDSSLITVSKSQQTSVEYGIHGHVLDWVWAFRAFLGSRSQQVVIGGEESESILVTSSIPQGSVLGLFLLIYINDLPNEVCSTVY